MGSGASRKGGRAAGKQGQQSGAQGAPADCSSDPPALRRRRRVLFGRGACTTRREFEDISPKEQFILNVPEDLIFERLGSAEVIDKFRRRAEEVQYHNNDGYLGENAIELLGLGLQPGCILAKRLFEVAQVQHVAGSRPRRKLLTCFELLALHSLLRAGEDAEILELLFCIFDVDMDDRVSEKDLMVSIDAFLALKYADEKLDVKDRDEFSKLDEKARKVEAKRLAELALHRFGSTAPDPAGSSGEEEEEPMESQEEAAIAKSGADTPSTAPPRGDSSTHRQRGGGVSEDEDDDDDDEGEGGTRRGGPDGGSTTKDAKSQRRRGLCRGKAPADGESDSSGRELKKDSQKKGSESSSRRGGLCGSRQLDEEEGATPKAKAKPKPKAKAKRRRALCGGSVGRKGPPTLGFDQWREWLAESELLPPGFGGLAPPASDSGTGAPSRPAQDDAGGGVGGDFGGPARFSAAAGPRKSGSGLGFRPAAAHGRAEDSDEGEEEGHRQFQRSRSQSRQMSQPLLAEGF